VASAFGIGAAKAAGRYDHAVPLTLEAVACSWPTPFGFLIPMRMGKLATGAACLGETALLFSMTRPGKTASLVPFANRVPLLVWVLLLLYAGSGGFLVYTGTRFWRKRWKRANFSQRRRRNL
jgi:hypothetical protein